MSRASRERIETMMCATTLEAMNRSSHFYEIMFHMTSFLYSDVWEDDRHLISALDYLTDMMVARKDKKYAMNFRCQRAGSYLRVQIDVGDSDITNFMTNTFYRHF